MISFSFKKILFLSLVLTTLFACSKDDDDTSQGPSGAKIFYGDVTIKTPEDLERFGKNYFSIIDGSITIASNSIDDLSPLITINEIRGSLSIIPSVEINKSNDTLKSLEGLQNLQLIGDELYLNFLRGLESLQGLRSLRKVGELFTLRSCNALTTLDGLEKLRIIGRDSLHDPYEMSFNITGNRSLTDFCGLRNAIYSGRHGVDYNAYNPTREEMKTNACKQ